MRRMNVNIVVCTVLGSMLIGVMVAQAFAAAEAEQYKVDPAHTSVVFKIKHLNTSYVYGRFNQVAGDLTTGDNSTFNFTVKTAGVDTGNAKRDDHLRSPDFFNANQFPAITFKSNRVTATDAGYEVTGDLSLHGQTKSVTIPLTRMGEADFPAGVHRVGFDTTFTINRSDFGMTNMLEAVGDEVTLMISFEGTRQ